MKPINVTPSDNHNSFKRLIPIISLFIYILFNSRICFKTDTTLNINIFVRLLHKKCILLCYYHTRTLHLRNGLKSSLSNMYKFYNMFSDISKKWQNLFFCYNNVDNELLCIRWLCKNDVSVFRFWRSLCETACWWNNTIIQVVLNETLSSYVNTKGAQKSDNSKLESLRFRSTRISHMQDEGKLI